MKQPEEKLLFAKVLDQADFCLQKHKMTFSDFMDIAKCMYLKEILCKIPNIAFTMFGGYGESERNMFGFTPDYMDISSDDFPIQLLEIKKNLKFGQSDLTHRDYLGSILGLGIDRSKIGDILLMEDKTLCFVHEEVAEYISMNLQKVSRTSVKILMVDRKESILPKRKLEQYHMTVSSLRLDAIVSAAFSISRGKAQSLIRSEKTTINWTVVSNTSFIVKEGDILSLRGYGRIKLEEVLGNTKKGRIGIEIGRYV